MKTNTRYLLIATVVSFLSITFLPSSSARHEMNKGASVYTPRPQGSPDGSEPIADLAVDKVANANQVAPGDNITYTITVMNNGTDSADNANLSDPLPAGLTFVSLSSPAGWNCTTPTVGAGGTVTCTNPTLAVTSGDVFTLVVNVPTDAPPSTFFSNVATVSSSTFDPNDENNSSTASTLVMGNSADIGVFKSTSSSEVPAGSTLTFAIRVTNGGPDSAAAATLNDPLPAGVIFVSLSQPPGWNCTTPAVGAGGTVNCSNPSLPVTNGDDFTLVVYVSTDTPATTVITNTATVSTTTPEPTDENNSSSASATVAPRDPTAANGQIRGRILDEHGNAVAGVVIQLNGTQSRKTITDADGNYRFDKVETNGFYTVTPAHGNYHFFPFDRSFSQIGNNTDAAFTATSLGDNLNPLDTPEYFVRQQYVDVLGREPDEAGFNYWSDQILACGGDVDCTRAERTGVASAFFIENEFKQSGAYVYNLYKGALGRRPLYAEYSADRRQVVGGSTLEAQKQAFAEEFVARAEFASRYASNDDAASFVDALSANVQQTSGVDLSGQRDGLIESYNTGTSQASSRTLVLRAVTESAAVRDANYNGAFVAVEYFGYLHRGPDQDGYDFWLNVLNTGDPGNYRGMVCSFITSAEYQRRFSAVVSHSNSECGGQ